MSGVARWRGSRPFWGGLFTVIGGLELLGIPFATQALPLVIQSGTVGASYLIAVVLIVVGLLIWLQPGQRAFLGVVAVLVSLASFVYANLGGFLIGMLLGLVGGALAAAWTPGREEDGGQDPVTLDGPRFTGRRVVSGDDRGNAPADAAKPGPASGDTTGVWIGRVKGSATPRPASPRHAGPPSPTAPNRPGPPPPSAPHQAGPPAQGETQERPGEDGGPGGGRLQALAVLPLIVPFALLSGSRTAAPISAHPVVAQAEAFGQQVQPSGPKVATEAATVTAPSLTMTGMKFHGVVEVPTATGTVKMLWFTMDRAVLSGPTQTMGAATLVGKTFTFDGDVDIYTTKMTGTLLGLRQEFTAENPNVLVRALKLVPRLDLPLTMTDIVSEQPYVTADSLDAQGLRLDVS
ncbi:hypothetical protein Pth03_16970 [Planotetraspora thailandica]|uniref:Uncharacterized protein n=1 Tax=Planotetraspora thailandica TaxID=487172 RepID=A0A8J3UWM4_9ACTN|nr:DUF6114 domain-containing protein [Planotetraspora thailandica]GII53308.1 hypothetical protein Pth03_16970 [Planotetraspora thailandica]